MPEMKRYDAGTPCWIELSTTDIEAAKKFYGDVLDGRTTKSAAKTPATTRHRSSTVAESPG